MVDDAEISGQTFVHRHIRELAGGRTVVVSRKPASAPVHGRPHFRYERMRLRLRMLLQHGLGVFRGRNVRDLQRFFRDNDVRFILAEFGYAGLAIHKEAARFGIPMLCYFRGADASSWLQSPKYVRRLREMMADVDCILAVSQSLIDNLERFGIKHANAHVIPSGVDTELFAPRAKDPNVIASVGRFIAKKGHLQTLMVFREVCGEFPELRLEMVGDGDLLDSCVTYVCEHGLQDRVVFHGWRDSVFIRELLSRSTLYLQHSVTDANGETEGMPTAIQEAMAAGNVVVATRHAGIPEHIVDGRNGILVPENDLGAYGRELAAVLRDRRLQEDIAKAARSYAVSQLEYRLCQGKIETMIRDLVALRKISASATKARR